jgi:hypothetical protein
MPRKKQQQGVIRGRWFRWSEYVLADGRFVPARGATTKRYSPWETYNGASKGRRNSPPYQTFLNCFRFHKGGIQPDVSALLAWMSEFGPLGIFLYRAQMIETGDVRFDADETAEGWEQSADQIIEFPTRSGWRQTIRSVDPIRVPEPRVLLRDLRGTGLRWLNLAAVRRTYFPDWKDVERLPVPNLDTYPVERVWRPFVQFYSEPLEEVSAAAALLQRAFGDPELLNVLTEGVGPLLSESYEGQMWVASSLLGDLGMMMLQDRTKKRVLTCARCKRPFLTAAYQPVQYCSQTCRYAKQKANQRRRAKVKKMIAEGRTIASVARELALNMREMRELRES